MRSLKLNVAVCLLAALPSFLFAQHKKDANANIANALATPGVNNIVGLLGLNPNKFSMSHSYSLSFGSLGGDNYNMGLYLNTMKYQLADPLTFHLQLGVQHAPFKNQVGYGPESQVFVSRAGMEYKPSDNLKLQIEFSQRPGSYYLQRSPFLDPITRNRSWFDKEDEEQEE